MSEYDAKWIHVYRNKDPHFPGVRFMVSPSQIKDEDVLLSEITKKIQPPFGAVRKLHTPVNGSRIRKLSEIKTHRKYVAAGAEKFQQVPGGYMNIGQKPKITNTKLAKVITANTELNITVFRNGKPEQFKNLKYNENSSIPPIYSILKDLNSAFPLKKGTYKQLYTLIGRIVTHSSELESGSSYVAVPNYEWFKKAPYGQKKTTAVSKKSSVSSKDNPVLKPIEASISKSKSQTDLLDTILQETPEREPEKTTERPIHRSVSALAVLQPNEVTNPLGHRVALPKDSPSPTEMGGERKRSVSLQTEKPLRSPSSISNTLSFVLDLQNANTKMSPEKRHPEKFAQMNNWLSPIAQENSAPEKCDLSTSLVSIFRAKKLSANFQRLPPKPSTNLTQDLEILNEQDATSKKELLNQIVIDSENLNKNTKQNSSEMHAELLAMQDTVGTVDAQQIARDPTNEADRLMESFQSFLSSSMTTEKKFFKELQSYDNTSVAFPEKRVHFDLSADPSGIWRAKTNLLNEAVEVPDSPHVTVDLPVDLKPTEIVQEEILAGRQKTNHAVAKQAPVKNVPAVKA